MPKLTQGRPPGLTVTCTAAKPLGRPEDLMLKGRDDVREARLEAPYKKTKDSGRYGGYALVSPGEFWPEGRRKKKTRAKRADPKPRSKR